MNLGRWTLRFLVIAAIATGLRIYWFTSGFGQSDFPTSEVQYAIMPALNHPYLMPWEAPYSVFWYAVNQAMVTVFLPFVQAVPQTCPNQCMVGIHYVNGTIVKIPFENGLLQYYQSLAWMVALTVIDIPFFWVFRQSELAASYFATSLWFWGTTPVNLSVFWIIALSFQWPELLPFALMFKLPFGAPLDVWKFAIGSGSVLGHWFPYGLLGLWWVSSLLHRVDRWKHQGRSLWVPWLGLKWRRLKHYEPQDRYLVRWENGTARFEEL